MFPFLLVFLLSFSWKTNASTQPVEQFLHCLSLRSGNSSITKLVYTRHNSSYSSVLNSSAQNFRFITPSSPTPLAIITPLRPSHVQATVYCCRKHGLQLRTRSGGHDFEGLSYSATSCNVPFVVIDLANLRSVRVDVEKAAAWVESGATIGELYYEIARKSATLAFPAGIGHTIGIGGHLSGGGYGSIFRKYGLAADNVIDSRLIDVRGRILDRKSMGEDLFWAIRGGGGGSFGIVLAWKLKLVPVPANLTACSVTKTLEQNATELVHRWQSIGHILPKEVHMSFAISRANSSVDGTMTVQASFGSVFLGNINELIPLMEEKFPELGLSKQDCFEMSWAESILYSALFTTGLPLETLLNRTQVSPLSKLFFKAKSDFVKRPGTRIRRIVAQVLRGRYFDPKYRKYFDPK